MWTIDCSVQGLTELKNFMTVNDEPAMGRQKLLRNIRVSCHLHYQVHQAYKMATSNAKLAVVHLCQMLLFTTFVQYMS